MKTEFRLIVSFDPPPILEWRSMCWTCIDDLTYDGAPDAGTASYVGIGSSPYGAIRDYLVHLHDLGGEDFAPGELSETESQEDCLEDHCMGRLPDQEPLAPGDAP